MKNMFWIIISLLIALTLFSCKKDDEKDDTHISNCCRDDALIASFSTGLDSFPTGQIFIPNVFTPNGDGINDVLIVNATGITKVNALTISDGGDQIFELTDFLPNSPFQVWDGSRDNETSNRIYDFQLIVTTLGDIELTFNGKVATLLCNQGSPTLPAANLENCKFPAQSDFAGGWDPQASSLESDLEDCFN